MGRGPHSAASGASTGLPRHRAANGAGARLLRVTVRAKVSRMQSEQSWKRPAAPRSETRDGRLTERPVDERRPGWTTSLAIAVPCAGVGIALGVALGSALVSPAAVAYIAAALFVGVLAFVIHLGGEAG